MDIRQRLLKMVDIKKWQDRVENLLQVQKDLCLEKISTTFTRSELIELRLLLNEMMEINKKQKRREKMTVMDFYKVTGISEKIMIRKSIEGNGYSYFRLLYDGSVDELPLDLLEMHVLNIKVSHETCSMIVTVD